MFFSNKPNHKIVFPAIFSKKISKNIFTKLVIPWQKNIFKHCKFAISKIKQGKSLLSLLFVLKSICMAQFKIAFQKTLLHEGNYSNDPSDLGGETYKGIARNMHASWSGWKIIDTSKKKSGFPATLNKDAELQKQVEEFYLVSFWGPLKAYDIQNQSNADSIFDFAVNTGIKNCIRIVQKVVGATEDGIIGNETLAKLNEYNSILFRIEFTLAKIKYYIAITKKRPANKKFLYGWIVRALEYA